MVGVVEMKSTIASKKETLKRLCSSISAKKSEDRDDSEHPIDDEFLPQYANYPLVRSMLKYEKIRNKHYGRVTKNHREYVKGTDGWIRSLLVIHGRALDKIIWPWIAVTINAVIWTAAFHGREVHAQQDILTWESIYSIVAKSTLAFLLVFRLNRIAVRYWETRGMWGMVTIACRCLTSSIAVHANHAPEARDRAIAYVAAFAVSAKHFIRREKDFPLEELAGILTREELDQLESSPHPALYAANKIREYVKEAFYVTISTPVQFAASWSIQMSSTIEPNIDQLVEQLSGMEKIRSTPLPLVYVTHLRTCLLFYLFTIPYVWEETWGWATVPAVSITAFALLGVEGAASECEIPFDKNRTNHLDMDTYCMTIINNIQQLVKDSADMQIQKQQYHHDRPENSRRFDQHFDNEPYPQCTFPQNSTGNDQMKHETVQSYDDSQDDTFQQIVADEHPVNRMTKSFDFNFLDAKKNTADKQQREEESDENFDIEQQQYQQIVADEGLQTIREDRFLSFDRPFQKVKETFMGVVTTEQQQHRVEDDDRQQMAVNSGRDRTKSHGSPSNHIRLRGRFFT